MDPATWNRGLLLSGLLIVIGGMSLVAGRSARDRMLALGILSQGIALMFVAGGSYLPRAEFSIAAVTLLAVTCLWIGWISISAGVFRARRDPLVDGAVPPSGSANGSSAEGVTEMKDTP
jgi:NADH:ubiquinone oxidoreductase subunit K